MRPKETVPSFTRAARPEQAIPLYEHFIDQLSAELKKPVAQGVFGAMMDVSLVNDGPVTIWLGTQAASLACPSLNCGGPNASSRYILVGKDWQVLL